MKKILLDFELLFFQKKYFILLPILILFLKFQAHAQVDFREGYVIQNNGDSLRGLVNYSSPKKSISTCYFKTSRKEKAKAYSPLDIRAYGYINNKRYESGLFLKGSENDTVFYEKILDGYVDLLKKDKIFYFFHDTLFKIPPPVKKLVEVKDGNHEGKNMYLDEMKHVALINYYFLDCKINGNNSRYNQQDLIPIVERYNTCHSGKSLLYKRLQPKVKFNYSVFVAYMPTSFSTKYNFSTYPVLGLNFDKLTLKGNGILMGADVDISFPRAFDKFAVNVGLWHIDNQYRGFYEKQEFVRKEQYSFSLDATHLGIPIGFRYNFNQSVFSPYVKAGYVMYFMRKTGMEVHKVVETNGNKTETDTKHIFTTEKNPFGFYAAAGATFRLSKGFRIFGEFMLEHNNGFIGNYITSESESSSHAFVFGVKF